VPILLTEQASTIGPGLHNGQFRGFMKKCLQIIDPGQLTQRQNGIVQAFAFIGRAHRILAGVQQTQQGRDPGYRVGLFRRRRTNGFTGKSRAQKSESSPDFRQRNGQLDMPLSHMPLGIPKSAIIGTGKQLLQPVFLHGPQTGGLICVAGQVRGFGLALYVVVQVFGQLRQMRAEGSPKTFQEQRVLFREGDRCGTFGSCGCRHHQMRSRPGWKLSAGLAAPYEGLSGFEIIFPPFLQQYTEFRIHHQGLNGVIQSGPKVDVQLLQGLQPARPAACKACHAASDTCTLT